MIDKLSETPKNWLQLEDCRVLYETYRETVNHGEPIPSFETRFPDKLEGILSSIEQTFGEEHLNATILEAAAAYFNQLIRGHPFANGNKRMAVFFTHIFLLVNGVDYTLSPAEMYNFAVAVAQAGENGVSSEKTKEWCKTVISTFSKEVAVKK